MLSDQIFELNWAHSGAQGNAYANPQSFSGHQSAYRSCFFSHTKNSSWYFDVLGRSLSCFVSFIVAFILEYLITSHIYPKLNLLLFVHPSNSQPPKTFRCITLQLFLDGVSNNAETPGHSRLVRWQVDWSRSSANFDPSPA